MKKVFSPDLMFNDYVKATWNKNVKLTECGNVPLQTSLKANGIYAIQIEPDSRDNVSYWAIGFPLNKLWKNESLNEMALPMLYFDCVSSMQLTLNVQFQSEGCQKASKVIIQNTDGWETYKLEVPKELNKQVKIIVFSGPMADMIVLLKNMYID